MRSHELIATAMVDGYYSKLNHGRKVKKKKKSKKVNGILFIVKILMFYIHYN